MSYDVVVAWARLPKRLRASVFILLGGVALGGCSASVDRFETASFGSGYGPEDHISQARGQGSQTAYSGVQRASYRPAQQAGAYQLASASADQPAGYLQVARVDLPPLGGQTGQASQGASNAGRIKTADGYGAYNKGPLPDGTYSGPRVYTPYDGARDDAPPPERYCGDSCDKDGRRYERDSEGRDAPTPPRFYRNSDPSPRVYEPERDPEPHAYEPRRERYDDSRAEERGRPPRENAFYRSPDYGRRVPTPAVAAPGDASKVARPFDPVAADRGNGKVVTVAQGDTLYTLAIRHGVTVDMIAKANGLYGTSVRPGQELLIPDLASANYAKVDAQPAKVAAGDTQAGARRHRVKQGETAGSLAREYGVPAKSILEANKLASARDLKAGKTIVIPAAVAPVREARAEAKDSGDARAEAAPAQANAIPAHGDGDKSGENNDAPIKIAVRQGEQVAQGAAAAPSDPEPVCDAALANPLPRAGESFRKPVEGRVIAQFGTQKDGTINEGITVSVPKGTPIKAAENGVVAYVGDELPGFGNLILIRHAGEYVTAYANADEVLVKKCDVVKRGQVVAKAGTTGDAAQPQLHFEIRKNSKPVDPASLLQS